MYATFYTFLAITILTRTTNLHCLNLKDFVSKRNAKLSTLTNTIRHMQTHYNEALGLGLSLGLATQYLLAEDNKEQEKSPENSYFSSKDINLKNPQAVLEGFAKATEAEKKELAKQVAKGIAWYKSYGSSYSIEDISSFLTATKETAHCILITAIAQNITRFNAKEIKLLLLHDPKSETHELIAKALKNNYATFTGYSFWGIELSSQSDSRKEYASILKALKPEYQTEMLQPILKNIEKYNIFQLLYYVDPQHKQTILEELNKSTKIDLSLYRGTEMFQLLRLTKDLNQRIVAQAIAKDVGSYTSWHFHGLFKLCTEDSKKIILNGIAKHMKKNEKTYNRDTIPYIKAMALELPDQPDSKIILAAIEKRNAAQKP